jgi:hypothetical protein
MSTTSLPKIRKATITYDFSKSREWLKAHRDEYIGKWIVLDGDKLIGAGEDPRPIVAQVARRRRDAAIC